MQDVTLQNDELQALIEAAEALKIPLETLKPVNPFRSDLKSPTAQAIQMWLSANRPEMSARLSGNSGHEFSLAAVAAERGLRSHNATTHQEMLENSEIYAQQHKQRVQAEEERILAEMSEQADKMAAARGYDPNSQIGIGNHGKFGRYFRELQEHQRLESQG